jgi:hypothetical protein
VNTTHVQNIPQLRQELRKIKVGGTIVLQVERSGLLSYLVLASE